MITRYESEAIGFQDDKITIQQEILEQRTVIARQEIEIAENKKQLEDYHLVKREFMTLKVEYDKLYDRY
jgi:trans-2-enoyl-CoA reductase